MEPPVASLLLKHLQGVLGTAIKIHTASTLSGGCINHATQISTNQGKFFTKWNTHGPQDLFLREAESLEELSKANTSLKIPKVYVKTEIHTEAPGFLVTDFLSPPTESSAKLDETLGRGLAELHQFQAEKYGFYRDNYCGSTLQDNRWNTDWVDFFGQQRIQHLLHLIKQERGLDTQSIKVYDQLMQKLPILIGHQPTPALNHGDLWSGNYMYSAEGPALIDPAAYYADREFDLAMMRMFGGFSSRVWSTYQEAYPLPPEWEERSNLYMLYHVLNHYYLFGGHYGQQALSIAKKYL
jgi:protein-ribulosamine 3-kinase